jgi:nucleoside-diphosphate-sugar epimerase
VNRLKPEPLAHDHPGAQLKILLTGSSGRIGQAIHAELARAHQVVGVDRVACATTDVVADLRDSAAIEPALERVDAIVHCAALHAPQVGVVDAAEFIAVNVDATRALAAQAIAAGVRRFVYTSTTALYGAASTPSDAAGWVDEDLAPQPRTIYHHSKLAAEAVLRELAASAPIALTLLRMSRCFTESAHLMAAYRLHRGIDARDVARAHALALESADTGVRTFVISAATPFRHEDLAELKADAPAVLLRRAPDLVAAFRARGWPLPASIDRVYSPALAQARLGWQPRHGFADVLAAFDAEAPAARLW